MEILFEREIDAGRVAIVGCTSKTDGDLSITTVRPDQLKARRAALVDVPWTVCRQIHSDRLIDHARLPAGAPLPIADAVMVAASGQVAAVHSADCVPVGFVHHGGTVAAAHAGWRGLERGVLESTVRALRSQGAGAIEAVVGPHIRAEQYEFGAVELARLATRFGSSIVATTAAGTPALDLSAAVTCELSRLGVPIAAASPGCTAVDADKYWSYRSRRESGRFALAVWMIDG